MLFRSGEIPKVPRSPRLDLGAGATPHLEATVATCKKVDSPGALKRSLPPGMTPMPSQNLRVGVRGPSPNPMDGAMDPEETVGLAVNGVTPEKGRRMAHPALPGMERDQAGRRALVDGENPAHQLGEAGEIHNAPLPQHRSVGVTSLRRAAVAIVVVGA